MSETLGEALLVLRTDDRGLDAGIENARGKSERLGGTLDNTSGKAVQFGKSLGDAGKEAGAAGTKTGEYSREVAKLKAAIDPTWGSLQTFRKEAALARQALSEGAISAQQYVEAMRASAASAGLLTNAQTKAIAITGAQRAGQNQLMMNFNDMATMYSMNANAMQIFTSQAGQLSQAMQLMSGGGSRFATIMGSPWTMAITTAAVVLVPLIANLFETEEAADKAGKASETFADKLDRNKHSLTEVIAAVREYNAEQKKSTETTLENAAAAAAAAAANIKEAISLRQKIQATLEYYQSEVRAGPTGPGGQGQIGAQAGAALIADRQKQNDARIAELERLAREATANLAGELAKIDTNPIERLKVGFAEARKEARASIKDFDELRKKLAEIERQEKAATEAVNNAARAGRSNGNTAAGDATRFISPVAGGSIRGRFGENRGNRDHAGIDIAVPVGTPVKAPAGGVVIEAGTLPGYGNVVYIDHGRGTISRLAHLSKIGVSKGQVVDQGDLVGLSGGAKGAPGAGNSRGPHVHQEVRVNGRPVDPRGGTFQTDPSSTQDRAEKMAEQAAREAEKEARRVERYSRDLAGLQDAALDLQARLAVTAEERFQLELQGLEITIAEQKRRIEANADYTAAEKEQLLAALELKAGMERQLLERRKLEELARQAVEIAQAMWDNERDLLEKQLQLSDVRSERRAIEQKILDESYKQHRAALEATIASQTATEAAKADARDKLSKLGENKSLDQQRLDRDYESPLDRYRREIVGVGNNLNDEMEKVAVSGIDRLSEGLVDVIANAKSLGDVFSAVAKQIIADLIRIAIQQLVVKALMSAIGGGGGDGGGLSLANLGSVVKGGYKNAGMFAKGGLIPTGSFGIVGEAGPEPIFATTGGVGVLPNSALRAAGMGGGPSISISIPIDATGADAAALGRVQSQLDRLEQELPSKIVRTVQDAGDRGIVTAGKWR